MRKQKLEEHKKRVPGISIKLTPEEKKIIQNKSLFHSIKPSTYLRNLGLNYPIKSTVDQLGVNSLLKANADLGRLGGLFKFWLTNNSEEKIDFSSKRTYKNIDDLVDEIEKIQTILKAQALNIMKSK